MRDQELAVAVDDLPARRLHRDLTHLVVLRLGQVAVAREHRQVPEAKEDDTEDHEREAAKDGDAERELRGHRRAIVTEHRYRAPVPRITVFEVSRGRPRPAALAARGFGRRERLAARPERRLAGRRPPA